MNATITMLEEDDPRASVIEDSNGIPFLVIGSPGSLGGLTVELTADLMADIANLVKGWQEEADAASRNDDGSPLGPISKLALQDLETGKRLHMTPSELAQADHQHLEERHREAQQLNPRSVESEWEEFEYHRHLR